MMRMRWRIALLVPALLLQAGPASAQQGEKPKPTPPPPTAEELHALRRLWLQQQRMGDTTGGAVIYGAARGPRRSVLPAEAGASAGVPGGGPYGAQSPYPYGPPMQSPYPYGFGYGRPPFGGQGVVPPYGVPYPYGAPQVPFGDPSFGAEIRVRLPDDPAYPPVGRFYSRFHPPLYPQAPLNPYGGVMVIPADPWRPPPWAWGLNPAGCAEVSVAAAHGAATVLHVPLPVLGALSAAELELAIDARLSQGLEVRIEALDGRWLWLAPRTELARLQVRPCR